MKFNIAASTDEGCVRPNNEDKFLINGYMADSGSYTTVAEDSGLLMAAVADGMGGMKAGEVASGICLEHLNKITEFKAEEEVSSIIRESHEAILGYGNQNPHSKGLGTTLAGLMVYKQELITFHVGDSRVYRFQNGFLRQLTTDHTLVQLLLDTGEISREEMEVHPDRHLLYQSLGGNMATDKLQPAVQKMKKALTKKATFLLCSDGLSDFVSLDEMESILASDHSLDRKVTGLISAAKEAGGYDNITVILVEAEE